MSSNGLFESNNCLQWNNNNIINNNLTSPHDRDSDKTPILFKVFFAGPVSARIKAYAKSACRPRFDKNCGIIKKTRHLRAKINIKFFSFLLKDIIGYWEKNSRKVVINDIRICPPICFLTWEGGYKTKNQRFMIPDVFGKCQTKSENNAK